VEPGCVIIGGDQIVACGARVFGKPGDSAGAVGQLLELSGTTHELYTALAVAHPGGLVVHTDRTRLHARRIDRAAAERYVAADRPYDCAGGYKLEERGISLFERIESDDQSAVTGLPLIALTTILRDLGYAIP